MALKTNIQNDVIEQIKCKNNVFCKIFQEYINILNKKGQILDINILKQNIEDNIFIEIIEECILNYRNEILLLQKNIDLLNKDKEKQIIDNFYIIIKGLNKNIDLLNKISIKIKT